MKAIRKNATHSLLCREYHSYHFE